MFLTSLLAFPDSIYSISGFQLLVIGGLFLARRHCCWRFVGSTAS